MHGGHRGNGVFGCEYGVQSKDVMRPEFCGRTGSGNESFDDFKYLGLQGSRGAQKGWRRLFCGADITYNRRQRALETE